MTKFSDTIIPQILHNRLGMHKVNARWILKHFLEFCRAEMNSVLATIVTGYETVVIY